jgi:hypothetical protein
VPAMEVEKDDRFGPAEGALPGGFGTCLGSKKIWQAQAESSQSSHLKEVAAGHAGGTTKVVATSQLIRRSFHDSLNLPVSYG